MTLQLIGAQGLASARGGTRTRTRLPGGDFKAPIVSNEYNGLQPSPGRAALGAPDRTRSEPVSPATDSATSSGSTRNVIGGGS